MPLSRIKGSWVSLVDRTSFFFCTAHCFNVQVTDDVFKRRGSCRSSDSAAGIGTCKYLSVSSATLYHPTSYPTQSERLHYLGAVRNTGVLDLALHRYPFNIGHKSIRSRHPYISKMGKFSLGKPLREIMVLADTYALHSSSISALVSSAQTHQMSDMLLSLRIPFHSIQLQRHKSHLPFCVRYLEKEQSLISEALRK